MNSCHNVISQWDCSAFPQQRSSVSVWCVTGSRVAVPPLPIKNGCVYLASRQLQFLGYLASYPIFDMYVDCSKA